MQHIDLLQSALNRSELFESLNSEQVAILAQRAELQRFEDGEEVVRQGEPGTELFIILEGAMAVVVEDSDLGYEYPILNLEPGQSFGELSLLTDHPRAATVRSTGPTLCARLSRGVFEQLLEAKPEVAITICRYLAQRIRVQAERTGLRHISLKVSDVRTELFRLLPSRIWEEFEALPVGLHGTVLKVAVTRPQDLAMMNALSERLSQFELQWVVCERERYQQVIRRLESVRTSSWSQFKKVSPDEIRFEHQANPGLSALLAKALSLAAEEFHLESLPRGGARCRFWRAGGFLPSATEEWSREEWEAIEVGLASICGRTTRSWGVFFLHDLPREVFVNRMDSRFGQRLRIRVPSLLRPDLTGLFGSPAISEAFSDHFRARSLTVVVGEPGTSTSSTLYCFLESLCVPEIESIITIESQINRTLEGITQVEYKTPSEQTKLIELALDQAVHTLAIEDLQQTEALPLIHRAVRRGCRVLLSSQGKLDELGDLSQTPHVSVLKIRQRGLPKNCQHCRYPLEHPDYSFTVYESEGCDECLGSGRSGLALVFDCELLAGGQFRKRTFERSLRELLAAGAVSPFLVPTKSS